MLFWMVACGLPSSPESPDAWAVATAERLVAAEHEIVERNGMFIATFPAMGMRAEFNEQGLRVNGHGLGLVAWGRGVDTLPLPSSPPPALGAPVPGLLDPGKRAIRRLEYAHGELTEWWAGQPDGLEHGWTVDASPPGDGPLSFLLQLDGFEVLDAQADAVQLVDDDGRLYEYQGLAAFDATGDPLPARFSAGPEGLVAWVDDTGAAYPVEIDPVLSTAGTTLTGASASSQFGYALASAGDVNNDGYDDLIVGSPHASSLAGRAYIFHGSASGLSTTAATTLSVSSAYLCGKVVAGGGDANADGYDDVALSCTYNGYVRVFHGSASGVSTTASTSLSGTVTARYGHALALDGDVHNDGYDDLLVGSPAQSSAKGRVYVYRGSSSGIGSSSSSLNGSENDSYFGQALAYAGDVNADGYDDVVVGAPYYSDTATYQGRVEVFHGRSSGVSSSASTEIDGAADDDLFGYSVDGGGDVNGDGYDDIIVGQFAASAEAWVYHGSTGGVSSTAATTLSEPDTSFGSSVAIVGDTDDDGYDDVACGALNAQTAYVYAGSTSGVGSTAVTSLSSSSGNYYGGALAGADVNGDGYADLAVADYSDSTTYGKVYVYLGYADADADGYTVGGAGDEDCDDSDAAVSPGARETTGDEFDQDCDGAEVCYADADGDGYRGTRTVTSADVDCGDAGEAPSSAPA
ncbi:MAG: FG-GAP repeat protein, partial [Deltaproteobacteria bacterium]|nr:FG-GAP repeat protein [Deltaproteobacteria bacterium]